MKVAILIPTMKRPEFIERTIAYYASLDSSHPIYIGDASGAEIAARTTSYLKQFSNLEIKYFNWEGMVISQTIAQLAEEALRDCEYCTLHGDDDYFVPSSLSRCAEFLSTNCEYRTAQGRAASFVLDRPGPYGEIQFLDDYWGVNALGQDTSVERLAWFGKNYYVTQFSTHRTAEFVEDSQHYREIRDDSLGELIHCFTFAIKGKSKFLDCLYLVRNSHEGIFHPGLVDWVTKEYWSAEYHKTLNALSLAVHETSDLSPDQAKALVSASLKFQVERSFNYDCEHYNRSLVAKFKASLPVAWKSAIRGSISDVRNMRLPWGFDASDMRLLRSKNSAFYVQFVPVLNSISNRQKVRK